MGGCRSKKAELCKKWAKFANRVEFLALPLDKLKNKVVCQTHFRTECFMNYLQNSLVKTAYPTLMSFGDVVVDLENDSPEEQEAKMAESSYLSGSGLSVKLHIPEMDEREAPQDTFVIDMLQSTEEDINISPGDNLMISGTPGRTNNQQNYIFDLNQLIEDKNITMKKEKRQSREPTILNATYKKANRIKVGSNVGCVAKKTPRKAMIVSDVRLTPRQEVLKESKLKQEAMRPDTTEAIEFISPDDMPEEVSKCAEESSKDLIIESMAKELGELKQMVMETVSTLKAQPPVALPPPPPPSTSTAESSNSGSNNGSKGDKNMNKMQLFNAIKRYLNPSMVALLRMEMFGGMDREWKEDEKEFSVELYNLGLNVYEFMRDEWRFRLPPEKTVKEWANL